MFIHFGENENPKLFSLREFNELLGSIEIFMRYNLFVFEVAVV